MSDADATETEATNGSLVEEPLLDLSTLSPKRPTIRIATKEHPDGKLYELHLLQDFGIEEAQALQAKGREFDTLWATQRTLNDTEGQRLKMLLDDLFETVLKAPKTVKHQMNDGLRSQVVMAFTLAPLAMRMAQEQREAATELEAEEEARQTTAN